MHLAILHHHLNRGGVTSVIANHLRALATLPDGDRPERVVVLYDGQHDGWPSGLPDEPAVELIVTPALAYDTDDTKADPAALAGVVRQTLAAAGLSADDTLLHTHNHSLGKNASLPGALKLLAHDGWRMLLQVHDFAEDNRPDNYRHLQQALGHEASGEADPHRLGAVLYPQAPGIHYATLTERDAGVLGDAGVVAERLHALPNPVAEFGAMPSTAEAKARVFPVLGLPPEARLLVYPVRGIRRKNLGEMLLLAAMAPEGTYFAVTLRPKNPVEAASFDRWRDLAERLELPCRFDTGGPVSDGGYEIGFQDALAAADAILTTSVAEGFGMVFLEAWLAGKPLIGRDLPEITREFKAAGMTFSGLWTELRAPEHLDADFGDLTPGQQAAAIARTRRPATPLDLGVARVEEDIDANTLVVRSAYSTRAIGKRLHAVYAVTGQSPVEVSPVQGERIVDHFAAPERQNRVRLESAEQIANNRLAATIALLSHDLPAQPTGETPALPTIGGIRAVVFDVYGTLLVSGSGDISLASEGARGAAAKQALQAVGADIADGDAVVSALHDAIHASHTQNESDHPEVEIRDIWRTALERLGLVVGDAQVERLTIEYECRVNPIGPMPGLEETLATLRAGGMELGIVSNAQFFTPLAFEPLTGRSLDGWGFDPGLCVWSYEHREAKPGTFLYERCAEALAERDLRPEQVLYVGNDLRNDVWPAQRVGFRTTLFAGDARSLRWRRDDPRLADVRPDALVTDLRQLLEIVFNDAL
ncbi:MAG: HAD family hydrolase [Planctomycetota bacterium]